MGWLFMTRDGMGGHTSAKAYLDAQLTYERTDETGTHGMRVLASSCLRNKVYYAAAQPYGGNDTAVFAVICLVRWNPRDKEGMVFGYKDMTEHAGPCEAECPERILALLGPTDHEYAIDWRRRCVESRRRRRRPIASGTRIQLADEMTFTDGHKGRDFVVVKRGRQTCLRNPETGQLYRLSRLMDRAWTVIIEPIIHRTVFPARA
ncbi:MAG: hypothetical protein H0X36_12030 [Sphingomonadaceae bacterium]|nr:hypothetical protein [Sphingomonadaceae bacterium]